MMIYEKLYLISEEIEKALHQQGEFSSKNRVRDATLWALDAICEMSIAKRKWTADPRGLLVQLIETFEPGEDARWGDRIREILKEIRVSKNNHVQNWTT
jgi:hypothetical protein